MINSELDFNPGLVGAWRTNVEVLINLLFNELEQMDDVIESNKVNWQLGDYKVCSPYGNYDGHDVGSYGVEFTTTPGDLIHIIPGEYKYDGFRGSIVVVNKNTGSSCKILSQVDLYIKDENDIAKDEFIILVDGRIRSLHGKDNMKNAIQYVINN